MTSILYSYPGLGPTAPNKPRMVRNPNSPEAIAARQAGLPDPTPPINLQLITDKKAGTIVIDLTSSDVDQKIGFIMTGGGRKNKRLVRNIVGTKDGRLTITSYYIDVDNKQWIIITGYGNELHTTSDGYGMHHFPLSTYPGYGIPGVGALGQNWRNQGRNVDIIQANVKRQYQQTPIEPNSDQTTHHPIDEFLEDFTGNA